jgi:drug/metabolite transporter (DMT)-like permease
VTHQYVNPVVAIALGALVLDEQLTLAIAAGAALIVGSVFVAVRSENAAARKLRSPGTADVRGTPADRTA